MVRKRRRSALMIIMVLIIGTFAVLEGMKSLPRPDNKVCNIKPNEEPVTSTELGIGWSTETDMDLAIKDAISMALDGKKYRNPTFAIILGAAKKNGEGVLKKAREIMGDRTKIYGEMSGNEELTNSVVVITITSSDIKFGVGSAEVSSSSSACHAGKEAIQKAVKSAGNNTRAPKLVLLIPAMGQEAQTVKGVKEIVGKANIVVCRTLGNTNFGVFGDKKLYANGVSSAVIYTSLPIGYSIIKRTFLGVKKPDLINRLFVWRCPILGKNT